MANLIHKSCTPKSGFFREVEKTAWGRKAVKKSDKMFH